MSLTKFNNYASVSNGLSLKSKILFSGISIVAKFAFHPDGTVNRYLTNLVDIQLPPSSTPISGVTSYDHTLDSARNLWFRVFIPADSLSYSSLPVILYFHGGGFVSFSPAKLIFNALCQKLAGDLAAIYISVAYRRSPENCWPAQYDDGFDVLRFLDDVEMREKIRDFDILANADLSRCFLAGDSAGGNIAHHVAVRACESEAQFKTVRIRGLIGIQPFFGGKERTESELQMKNHGLLLNLDHTDFYWEAFLPNGSDRDHPGANVFGPSSMDLSGLGRFPPTLVVVGGLDLLQDWQRRYCDELKRLGKEVELWNIQTWVMGFMLRQSCLKLKCYLIRLRSLFINSYLRNDIISDIQ
ncbi:putative carboxylesterase 18 [Bienertia sinuspersici]